MSPSPFYNRVPPPELPFPFNSACLDDCPKWLEQFSGLSLSEVSNAITDRWRNVIGPGQALAHWLAERPPVSVVLFDWTEFAISLQIPFLRFRLFIRDAEEIPASTGIAESYRQMLNPFLGIFEGRAISPAGGFRRAKRIEFVNFSTNPKFWVYTDPEWEGAIAFYDTACGNQLLLSKHGHIGKWNHEDLSTRRVFESFEAFASEYIRTQSDGPRRDSPLQE